MHVQCTCKCFVPLFFPPAGQTKATDGPKHESYTYATPICVLFWLPFLGVQDARARTEKLYSRGVLRFLEIFS